jgi:hypothetical protein
MQHRSRALHQSSHHMQQDAHEAATHFLSVQSQGSLLVALALAYFVALALSPWFLWLLNDIVV